LIPSNIPLLHCETSCRPQNHIKPHATAGDFIYKDIVLVIPEFIYFLGNFYLAQIKNNKIEIPSKKYSLYPFISIKGFLICIWVFKEAKT